MLCSIQPSIAGELSVTSALFRQTHRRKIHGKKTRIHVNTSHRDKKKSTHLGTQRSVRIKELAIAGYLIVFSTARVNLCYGTRIRCGNVKDRTQGKVCYSAKIRREHWFCSNFYRNTIDESTKYSRSMGTRKFPQSREHKRSRILHLQTSFQHENTKHRLLAAPSNFYAWQKRKS